MSVKSRYRLARLLTRAEVGRVAALENVSTNRGASMRRKLFVGTSCLVLLVGTAFATVTSASRGDVAARHPKKATGSAVTVGFVTDGKTDAIDNTPELKAAQAAVSYANNYLGGLAGAQDTLNVCQTQQTPSGATDCATNMVQAKVPVVVTPVSGQSGTIYKGLKDAAIPFLQYGSIDQACSAANPPPPTSSPTASASALAGPAGIAAEPESRRRGSW